MTTAVLVILRAYSHEHNKPQIYPCNLWLRSKSVFLQPAIQRATAESEGFGGAVRISLKPRECLFDQQPLCVFETHLFQPRRQTRVGRRFECKVERCHHVAGTHQDSSFDHMIE